MCRVRAVFLQCYHFFNTRVQQLSYNVLQALDAQAAPAAPASTQTLKGVSLSSF
jgi:hypothetical protein